MDIKQITYFLAIAEERSISKASGKLYISQPSLSSFLNKLEASLGTRLFVRYNNKSLELTPAGEAYLQGARQIADIYTQLMNNIADIADNAERHMSLGFAGVGDAFIVAQAASRLCELYPGVRIEIVERGAFELMNMLDANELDMTYAAYDKEQPDTRLNYVNMLDREVDLVVPLAHPLAKIGSRHPYAGMHSVPLQDVGDSPFAILKENTIFRKVAERYFDRVGFRPNIQIETESNNASFNIVEQGTHSGLCPSGYKSDSVAYLALDPPIIYSTGVYYKKGRYLNKIMKDCIKILEHFSAAL